MKTTKLKIPFEVIQRMASVYNVSTDIFYLKDNMSKRDIIDE